MHEAVVAQVDAYMRVAAAQRVEEHQVARLQLLAFDGRAHQGHRRSIARQLEPQPAFGRISHQAAAIETFFGRRAPIAIAHAELVEGDRKSTRLNSSHVKISYA